MQSMVFTAHNEMQIREMALPELRADDLYVRVDLAGICGSDLHAYRGHDPRRVPPMVLGHEFVGTVLNGPMAGKRITANPLVTCGKCRFCIAGRGNLCSNRSMIGMNLPGAFAQQIAVPQQCAIELPNGMKDVAAALTEPAATVVHALALSQRALSQPLAHARCLVIGAGAIGLLTVLALRGHGVMDIEVVESNTLRAETLAQVTHLRSRSAQEVEAGAFDLVIDAVGIAATRDVAIAAVAAGGVVTHVGLGDWASPLDWRALTLREITLIGCYTYTAVDLHMAVAALHKGFFGDLAWVQERPLAEGPVAFADLVAGRVASPKVMLRPA
jgi:2-desacetyl-2-hydroxyethyl bacteriochlorophyllide A dehydrogenase